jgi:hypothetical protein
MLEQIMKQHDIYVEYTRKAEQFPVNLVLTLNASAIAAMIFFLRGMSDDIVDAIIPLQIALILFGVSSFFIFLAAIGKIRLYNYIAARKRKILKVAMERDNLSDIVDSFVSEAENNPSSAPPWIRLFSIIAYAVFILGAFAAGDIELPYISEFLSHLLST